MSKFKPFFKNTQNCFSLVPKFFVFLTSSQFCQLLQLLLGLSKGKEKLLCIHNFESLTQFFVLVFLLNNEYVDR